MIDLHFHCLPFIDDGPKSWDDAVALCRLAAEEGVTTIVATPHVLRDPWINDDPRERDELLLKLNDLVGGSPAILPGCELYFTTELADLVEEGPAGPLTLLNRGDHVLVEFPALSVPRSAEHIFHELELMGVTPVIAHPERNLELAGNPFRLADLIDRGAKAQVTAASLLGDFGPSAYDAAIDFHQRGLITIIASDSHNTTKRPPRMKESYDWVAANWGPAEARRLFVDNPSRIIGAKKKTTEEDSASARAGGAQDDSRR
jgi:protein-tyrosine phosphatase